MQAIHHTLSHLPQTISQTSRWHIEVEGVVQGVGFRPFVAQLATQLQLVGWVENVTTGVVVEVQGPTAQLALFSKRLVKNKPVLSHIEQLTIKEVPCVPTQMARTFEIRSSRTVDGRTLISADVAVCSDCVQELFEKKDHRFLYPFINCTNCGPRFSIIQDVPYDRQQTTMSSFDLCPVCKAEYQDQHNRRYHAQPVACATCGPHIWFADQEGKQMALGEAALDLVVDVLKDGHLIALRGLGGFHICCLAHHEEAVLRLRASKLRPTKPLALMVNAVADVYRFAELNAMEETILSESEAPIVLLKKKRAQLPDAISPQNGYVGVMLPYTPLHHVLMEAIGHPLVMTSGNVRGAPICKDNDEAIDMLRPFVDGFLLHNRPIARRCDDSVVMVSRVADQDVVQPIRRSRGFAPLPVMLPDQLATDASLLAVGADLKNVSAISHNQQVFLSAHIGDLGHPLARDEQKRALDDLQRLFRIVPNQVVCDLHPLYASTRLAQEEAQKRGVPVVGVQHHHAHIASCMVDARTCDEPVIGFAFDGTGYGTDGHIWGGEVMVCDLAKFDRVFHLEYLPLPGGDAAIENPYRIALAYLMTLVPHFEVTQVFPNVSRVEIDLIARMIKGNVNSPLTSSMGRLFDAVGAVLGLGEQVHHEGQVAMALEDLALQCEEPVAPYDYAFDLGDIKIGPMLDGLLTDKLNKKDVTYIARRFHITLAHLVVDLAVHLRKQRGHNRVALSGGVWQNRLLMQMTTTLLAQHQFEVLVHNSVPANDGGIALGQIAVAAAMMKE